MLVLNGLATVAAVARSRLLADELRILVRKYVQDIEIEESIMICLVAASSHKEINDWRDFVGDWLAELAFGELEGNDSQVLHTNLQYLCHIVPELWASCGRVDAALRAFEN